MGPGPQPILASFAHLTPLCYADKISEKMSGAPLNQILDLLVPPTHNTHNKDIIILIESTLNIHVVVLTLKSKGSGALIT